MAEILVEKEICDECGADVRENSQFCYNCGTPRENDTTVAAGTDEIGVETDAVTENGNSAASASKAALDDLAAKLSSNESTDDEKLAQAAEHRRRARVVRRQPKQFVWEPVDDMHGIRILLLAILVAAGAAAIVFITIFWK
jgi:hypothetical protein